jgi:hypothetical protein
MHNFLKKINSKIKMMAFGHLNSYGNFVQSSKMAVSNFMTSSQKLGGRGHISKTGIWEEGGRKLCDLVGNVFWGVVKI